MRRGATTEEPKEASNAGITYKLEMVPTCHTKSAVCGQKVAVVKTRSLKELWRCDSRLLFLSQRLRQRPGRLHGYSRG